MKTIVITFSTQFEGEPTNFERLILDQNKIHTIRDNFDYWSKQIQQVVDAKARLSLRVWTGAPRRSKQREFLSLTSSDGVGISKIIKTSKGFMVGDVLMERDSSLGNHLAINDGLDPSAFAYWFESTPIGHECALIHLNSYRYHYGESLTA